MAMASRSILLGQAAAGTILDADKPLENAMGRRDREETSA